MTDRICGVDVSKDFLDARVGPRGPSLRVAYTPAGLAELADFCAEHEIRLVAMEATGGYERLAFEALWATGLSAAVVNPREVRRFAQAMGLLEKTDRLDAGMIAHYAAVKQVEPTPPATPAHLRLRALTGRLRQLVALKVAQTNQRRLADDPLALASVDELLAVIRRQIKTLATEIAALVRADPMTRALDQAFREIKGVSDRTVATLLAEFAEIGTLSNKAAGKLAGLAPIAQDSGRRSGRRSVRGGRRSVRALLYVVAGVVRRHDPDFIDFYQRLRAAGKPSKVIRVALARKLLVRLNAKAREARAQIAQTA